MDERGHTLVTLISVFGILEIARENAKNPAIPSDINPIADQHLSSNCAVGEETCSEKLAHKSQRWR